MTLNAKRTWTMVMGIVMLVVGILYTVLIFTLPLGIPTIIGGARFIGMSNLSDEQLLEKINKRENFGWSIYAIIVVGVIGVLGMIFVYCLETAEQFIVKKEEENIINNEEVKN